MRPDAVRIEKAFDRLWPICRSIAGPGFRESLDILSETAPFQRLRFKTGTKVLDWTVPPEWHPRDAYLVGPDGRRHAEFTRNNLHLVNFSEPVQKKMGLAELKGHLHSLPDQPDAVPYLTSYYQKRWGFCLTHNDLGRLPDGEYEVVVDTAIRDGALEIGEAVLPGESKREILFSSYLCHPSLANNELSGPLALAFLYERLSAMPKRRYTYRFAVMPETIGAICYLSQRGDHFIKNLDAGFQMTCLGDRGNFTYKRSRRGNTLADRAAAQVLGRHPGHTAIDFTPATGSDERQYCSPGFDLPVGSLMRTMYGRYPEYHTSLDNKALMDFDRLAESVDAYVAIVETLEENRTWKNTVMRGEPQLGRHGLYPTLGSQKDIGDRLKALLWLLNLADGSRDLIEIARVSGAEWSHLTEAARNCAAAGLLKEAAAGQHDKAGASA